MEDIILSLEQQTAFDGLYRNVTQGGAPRFSLLTGYAGTGKTTLTKELIRALRERGLKVVISAPTHKAIKVIRKDGEKGPIYATIHKLLGVKPQINDRTGKLEFVADMWNKEEGLGIADVLIVEEASMLDDFLFDLIITEVPEKIKVIFIGDAAQIPPVSKTTDKVKRADIKAKPFQPAIQEEYRMDVFKLEEVRRQALDNPVLAYATEIRELPGNKPEFLLPDYDADHLINAKGDINTVLEQLFKTDAFANDPDYAKVIAWTNVVVNNYNERIRTLLYGVEAPAYVVGEKLVMDEPYAMKSGAVVLQNSDELEIIEISTFDKTVDRVVFTNYDFEVEHLKFKAYSAVVEYISPTTFMPIRTTIHILHESEVTRWDMVMRNMAKTIAQAPGQLRKNLWKIFYQAKGSFAWVKYNYAITAHKSQGSSYTHTVICLGDTLKNPHIAERNCITYVAVSRTRDKCYIIY